MSLALFSAIMSRRFLSLAVSILLIFPAPAVRASQSASSFFNKDGSVSVTAVQAALQAMEGYEQQATLLMSSIAPLHAELAWWLTEAVWQDVEPEVQQATATWLANAAQDAASTAGAKAPAPGWSPSSPNAENQQKRALPAGASAATSAQEQPLVMIDPAGKFQALWATLKPKAEQLVALEGIIDQYRQLLEQVWPKVKDNAVLLDAGLLRFAQLNIHTTTRRILQNGVQTPLPDVATREECQGGLVGSLAFLEALDAAVDFQNLERHAAAQAALHTQHACLDVSTSLRHEIAYVAAIEHEERRLAGSGLAAWYPMLAAANVPVIVTLWDGKQSLGPTPLWNWLRLNKPLLLNSVFNASGIFALDRTTGAMVKIDICPGKGTWQVPSAAQPPKGSAPVPESWWAKSKFMPAEPVPAVTGTAGLSLPYNKGSVQDPAIVVPQAIDPNQFYTPYGVAWSGNPQHLCSADHFLKVVALQGDCLQPSLLLDRLGDATAWGFGNCTLAEFVADGLRCRQPWTLCEDPKLFPAVPKKAPPAVPFQIGGGNPNLLECLVANVQPVGDALLMCAQHNPLTGSGGGAGEKGAGGSGIAASDGAGGTRNSGGSGDSAGFGGARLFTPGSQFCGHSMAPMEGESGDQGTQASGGNDSDDDDDGGGNDKAKHDDDDAQEQSNEPTVTTSPDGKNRTYDFPPQIISGGGRQQQQAGSAYAGPPMTTQTQGGHSAGGPSPSGRKNGGPGPRGSSGGPKGNVGGSGTPSGPSTPGKHFYSPPNAGNWQFYGGNIPLKLQNQFGTILKFEGNGYVVLGPADANVEALNTLVKKEFGSWEYFFYKWHNFLNKVRQILLHNKDMRFRIWLSFKENLKKAGLPPVSWEKFNETFLREVSGAKKFGFYASILYDLSK